MRRTEVGHTGCRRDIGRPMVLPPEDAFYRGLEVYNNDMVIKEFKHCYIPRGSKCCLDYCFSFHCLAYPSTYTAVFEA